MIQYSDKDRSQKILGYRKKNFWYFNNYARLDGIDNQRFVCAGIAYNSIRFGFEPEEFKEDNFKSLMNGYSKTATEIYLGQNNVDSQSYKEGEFCFPYDWEYGAFALNVLHFYMEDLEFLENSNNRGYVTIKAYLEHRATKDKPYLLPDLEQVAKNKILDLWSYGELGREGKEGIKNFFSFHLQKYKGSPTEFMKYVLSFMIEICLEDTIDNIRLFAEFKAWHDEKLRELGLNVNPVSNKGTNNVREQIKINLDNIYEKSFEQFKERYFIGLKISTSLIDVAKYYDLFDKELKLVLSFAGLQSINTKLETVREVKRHVLMSLGNAEQIIGLERNGVYEHPQPSTFVVTKEGIDGLIQRVDELGKNIKEPLIVAKANKRVYEDIISLLDREEEIILIELRNGKSLDYSPLNDKKDNGNPTTSATMKESKEVEKKKICKFSSLQIAIAVTMVNQKNGLLFPKEFSKKDIEAKKKFLKDIEEKFLIENVPNDQLFRQYAKLKLSKEYLQNLGENDKKRVKEILELGRYTELLKDIK